MRWWQTLPVAMIAAAIGAVLSSGCKSPAPPSLELEPAGAEALDDSPAAEAPSEDAPAPPPTALRVERNATGGITVVAKPGEMNRALDVVLAELDARDLAELDARDLDEQSPEQRQADHEAPAANAPPSEWALMSREGDCAELSSLQDGIPQLRRAPDPSQFVALFRSQGVDATATPIPGTNGELVEVRVPTEELGMIFIRRSRCRTITAR